MPNQEGRFSSSLEGRITRILSDGGILVADLNRLTDRARYGDLAQRFALQFMKLQNAKKSEIERIQTYLGDLKYLTSKTVVDFETERRESVVVTRDTNSGVALESASRLL